MTTATYQILYVVERALENAADQPGIRPVRVYRVAFPLHVAEVSATVTAREPFDLLDRYVGLAIADGGFRSEADIARYLGVTEHIVRRVLLFLIEIRHITGDDGALALTELGQRAVRDDTRYIPKEDRLKLYFDGVRCAPLPSKYYSRSVRVLSRDDALNQRQFGLLNHTGEFSTASVAALARRRDRADYNLPDEHENLTVRAVGQAFLPCYLIRAPMQSGYRSLIYTAADSSASDAYLEEITRNWPGLDQVMHTEDNTDAAMREELTTWLDERGLSTTQLNWDGYDVPRLTLPARCFSPGDAPAKGRGEFPLRRVGSYVTPRSFVIQLWCSDPEIRREAALQRALEYADVTHRNETAIIQFLEQISVRLAVEPQLSVSDLRAYARRTGRGVLGT